MAFKMPLRAQAEADSTADLSDRLSQKLNRYYERLSDNRARVFHWSRNLVRFSSLPGSER